MPNFLYYTPQGLKDQVFLPSPLGKHRPLPLILFFFILFFTLLTPTASQAENYAQRFAKGENFYLFHPPLVSEFFLGLVELRGNPARARAKIKAEILACAIGTNSQSTCQQDHYRIEKKKRHISNQVIAKINWTAIEEIHRGKTSLLRLTWRPELINTEIRRMEDYLQNLNVAYESGTYRIPREISRVQFALRLPRRVEIRVERRLAKVLLELYQNPPQDQRDEMTLVFDSSTVLKDKDLASFTLFLKADSIRINHLKFKVEPAAHAFK